MLYRAVMQELLAQITAATEPGVENRSAFFRGLSLAKALEKFAARSRP